MRDPRRITVEEAFERAKGSMELEGFQITEKDRELILARARGEIPHEEFICKALALAMQGQ